MLSVYVYEGKKVPESFTYNN